MLVEKFRNSKGYLAFKKTVIYKYVLRTIRFLLYRFYPTGYFYNLIVCAAHRGLKMYCGKMQDAGEYIQKHGHNRIVLLEKETVKAFHNSHWGEKNQNKEPEMHTFPEVICVELDHVCAYGGTGIITAGKTILEPVYTEKTKRRWRYLNNLLKTYDDSRGILCYRSSGQVLEEGILLTGSAGGNYYHFLVEVLPKLALIEKNCLYPDVPILVDAIVQDIPTLTAALKKVNTSNHPIVYLEDLYSYQIKKMIYVSTMSLMPMNLWPNQEYLPSDFLMSQQAISCLKESIVKKIEKSEYPKIYVARYKTKNARLVNDEEIANLCEQAGFHVIFPEKMSFQEQVSVFMGAKYIIGCMGAAYTNLMFCDVGAQVYEIKPREHTIQLWSTYGNNRGLEMTIVPAKITKKSSYPMGDLFEVCPQLVSQIIGISV